jgi:hypothetical protein
MEWFTTYRHQTESYAAAIFLFYIVQKYYAYGDESSVFL